MLQSLNRFNENVQPARSKHEIDMWCALKYGILVFLGHTTDDSENSVGFLFFPFFKTPDGTVHLVFGVLANAACVEKDDIRVAGRVGLLHSCANESGASQFAVQDIHLEPKRFNVEILHCVIIPIMAFARN